jgi:small subunit ribosomal protein S11
MTTATAAPVKTSNKKKTVVKQVPHGRAYIQATFNNTLVSVTDQNGDVLGWASSGMVGFKGPKKATPYAASVIVRDVVEKAKDYGLKDVHAFISGVGQGREGAIRGLNANNLNILSIKDVTPIPHNGCRPPRPRRV